MLETLLANFPETKDECRGMNGGDCDIMQYTLYGDRLPHCFCFEKSMGYLQTLDVVE